MPRCEHCQQQWTFKQSIKKSFTLVAGMSCPYCETDQYLTKKARRKTSMLNFLPAPSLLLPSIFGLQIYASILFFLVALTIMLVLYPNLMELTSNEETLF
ncbi:TIGR04104 family putative zinc finger protein [Gracilibacillus massiliensis]|uniref:TIGR04104 family putative zinc finger protein n=1 Tax=Gracilibacillus massiliensis TaxID=1564956 RepID=UPI00071CE65B|nr:TIGR04104 family putative zinc finger protein [Gracilibacillus massiliensis]